MSSQQSQARTAAVLTVSDGAAAGQRTDDSGRAVAELLENDGFAITERRIVADEQPDISAALRDLAANARLVVSNGGTGLGPRDVTPEATEAVIDRPVPGLAEAMRATGRQSTPMADLSRGVVGAAGATLIINLPGSPRGALESLDAIRGILPHALDLLGGNTAHTADHATPPALSDQPPRGHDHAPSAHTTTDQHHNHGA